MKKLRIFIIDGEGRGNGLAYAVAKSPRLDQLYIAPGNPGTQKYGTNVPIASTDIKSLVEFAKEKYIDLTIVGQDDPLAMGIVDLFKANGLRIFGPTRSAARIESSKIFAKDLMTKLSIPTARYTVFDSSAVAIDFVRGCFLARGKSPKLPIVIKADGPAQGKGVSVCKSFEDALEAIQEIMIDKIYKESGDGILIEDFVEGQEISLHAFCDGKNHLLLPSAQDHKPVYDGDKGKNTGGMGTYSPVPWFTPTHEHFASSVIIQPLLQELRKQGTPFVGCLFPGIKMCPTSGPMVLEFNDRFGDPETQVHMRRLKTDFLDICEACMEGRLSEFSIEWSPHYAVCIVLTSEGYPLPNYKKGLPITGVEEAEKLPGIVVFHAGTTWDKFGNLVTSGGRVLNVTATAPTLEEALDRAYAAVRKIKFAGMHYRSDIGAKALPLTK